MMQEVKRICVEKYNCEVFCAASFVSKIILQKASILEEKVCGYIPKNENNFNCIT
jgi:hypothetical protein